ncbi:MAG: DegT/DnrJ/EryC1/StrS family aminotransferase [Thermoguttaceae bacterium]|jgi:dTDP-4-amino-4,6-dideoxygalactose transaminase
MHVPLHDLTRQYRNLAEEIDVAVRRVLASGWYILGREDEAFERAYAAYCGRAHAVAVANGTDALEIALRGIGCAPGDEVITVANAGGYTTTACLLVGATPVYVDVERTTLTISPASVVRALSPRTKAVVATHLYGKLADVDGLRRAVAGRDICIIEDCAQAHGAIRDGRRAGNLGDLGTFSFYPTKNLGALGDGGAIVADDEDLARRLRKLRQYGWQEKYHAAIPFGRNSRMDELQAAILLQKIPHLDGWNQRRRSIATRYCDAASDTRLRLVHAATPDYVAHLCVARHPQRDRARRWLEERGVGTAIHYPVLDHRQDSLGGREWRAVELTETESAQAEILTVPCFPELTDLEIDYVCDAIRGIP